MAPASGSSRSAAYSFPYSSSDKYVVTSLVKSWVSTKVSTADYTSETYACLARRKAHRVSVGYGCRWVDGMGAEDQHASNMAHRAMGRWSASPPLRAAFSPTQPRRAETRLFPSEHKGEADHWLHCHSAFFSPAPPLSVPAPCTTASTSQSPLAAPPPRCRRRDRRLPVPDR